MAKSKVVSVAEAMKHCYDGMTIMLPGFVNCDVSPTLIDGLIETFGNMPEEQTESNIVNLFGKKDKK